MLLQRGADYTALSPQNDSILHYVTRFANVRMVDLLAGFGLPSLDVELKNNEGLTAREILNKVDHPLEILSAFQRLL